MKYIEIKKVNNYFQARIVISGIESSSVAVGKTPEEAVGRLVIINVDFFNLSVKYSF